MKREAFKMYLKPGCEAEYEKRHAAIWPELKALLSQNGVSDYSIYWDKETNILFAFQKTEGGAGSQDLGNTEIVQKWWDYMADILEGKHAGVFTVGVVEGSSEMGLTEEEYDALTQEKKEEKIEEVRQRFQKAGADAVILHMGELLKLL